MIDGKPYECEPLHSVFIVGTKAYINALGARSTVIQLTPVDIKPHLKTFVDAADAREKTVKKAAPRKQQQRGRRPKTNCIALGETRLANSAFRPSSWGSVTKRLLCRSETAS